MFLQDETTTGRGLLRAWRFPLGTPQESGAIASLLELMVGYQSNDRGAVEPTEKWDAVLHDARRANTTGIAGWALADRDARPIDPFTKMTQDEYIRAQLSTGSLDALREARRLFPWDPRVSDKGVIR